MNDLSTIGLIITSLGLVGNCIIYIINNFNTTVVERKLMSNFQKVRYPLSLSFVSAIVVSTFIIVFEGDKLELGLFISFISLFIFSVIVYVIVLLGVDLFFILKNRKYTFKITLDSGRDWKIIKATNHKGLLLERGRQYKFIKDYHDMPITMEENN
ncbi:hypothetical protein [Oceanobacillus profundus]|uniref:hypothetical protein n=1 Tax=Oceanobacillus TaxID=182709 RepID=UPI0026E336B1|nr:hypothetical protein [Oceanobacillus profundus]MDO6448078.1 hypothetical protein [Oceanobacillus profundus]